MCEDGEYVYDHGCYNQKDCDEYICYNNGACAITDSRSICECSQLYGGDRCSMCKDGSPIDPIFACPLICDSEEFPLFGNSSPKRSVVG